MFVRKRHALFLLAKRFLRAFLYPEDFILPLFPQNRNEFLFIFKKQGIINDFMPSQQIPYTQPQNIFLEGRECLMLKSRRSHLTSTLVTYIPLRGIQNSLPSLWHFSTYYYLPHTHRKDTSFYPFFFDLWICS